MHLLKSLIIALLLASCTASGPVSPEDAFDSFREAYISENSAVFFSLITDESREKIKSALLNLKSMDENSKTGFCRLHGIKKEALETLSMQDFVRIYIVLLKKSDSEINKALTSEAVRDIQRSGNNAEILMSNGIRIRLERRFPYWKIDATLF